MKGRNYLFGVVILLLCSSLTVQIPSSVTIATIVSPVYDGIPVPVFQTILRLAVENVNNQTTILPNTTLKYTTFEETYYSPVGSTALTNTIIAHDEMGLELLYCCVSSNEATLTAPASTIYQMPMLSFLNPAVELNDRDLYPYFSRIISTTEFEAVGIVEVIHYLYAQTNIIQYTTIGIISTTDSYGVDVSRSVIEYAKKNDITVATYQQFLRSSTDIDVEIGELQKSNARVFVAALDPVDGVTVLNNAGDLIGDTYVWFCSAGCSSTFLYINASFYFNETRYDLSMGMIGSTPAGLKNALFFQLMAQWVTLDPVEYPGAGPNTFIDNFSAFIYDGIFVYAKAIQAYIEEDGFYDNGKLKDFRRFIEVLRNTTHEGLTGFIIMDNEGNRFPFVNIQNVINGSIDLVNIGTWNQSAGLVFTEPIHFHDGSTTPPDLDIRQPYDYWSCDDGAVKTDKTGKSVKLYNPGDSNPSNIKKTYHCDQFVDCYNISDEAISCSSNYLVLYIVFGVIAIVLILVCIFFFGFTIAFGFMWPKQRVRASSPFFLIIILLSCIMGFASIFAWYGKPQKVACAFQPWLLGLSVVSMTCALVSKTFRIWRIFRIKLPSKKNRFSDLELFIFWLLLIIPAVFILFLWTLISTPTARLETVNGEKHEVCDTGGFTGPPGGYIFFAIFVAYTALIALFGAFLSIVTRKVPTLFNESKLVAISIYNLVFVAIIIIPCVLVLNQVNPFISWIIRTIGVLYCFASTLLLQFLPKLFGLIYEKIKAPKGLQFAQLLTPLSQTNTASSV